MMGIKDAWAVASGFAHFRDGPLQFRCRYCMPEEVLGPDYPFAREKIASLRRSSVWCGSCRSGVEIRLPRVSACRTRI